MLSTQLILQIWLAVANFAINLFGFLKGAVSRKTTSMVMVLSVVAAITFSLLLQAGGWFLTVFLAFGRSEVETVLYWVSAGITLLYILFQVPTKMRQIWRNATVSGALQEAVAQQSEAGR